MSKVDDATVFSYSWKRGNIFEIYFFSLNYRGKALNFYWKTILVADLLYIGQNVANKVKYGVEKI